MDRQTEQRLRSLELLTSRAFQSVLAGEYQTMQKGVGVEFYQLRDYVAGDDVRFIDWSSTLRLGKTMVRDCIEQRQQTVVILLDISASQSYGIGYERFELFQKIAAILVLAAARVGDRCAIITFTNKVHEYWAPRGSSRNAGSFLERIMALQTCAETTMLMPAILRAQHEHHNQGLFFLLSDCLASDATSALSYLVQQEDAVVIRALESLEREFNLQVTVPLEDVETGQLYNLAAGDTQFSKAVAHMSDTAVGFPPSCLLDINGSSNLTSDDSKLVDTIIDFFMFRKIANVRRV